MSKPRPPNAAGPNGLRGGLKTYKSKTLTGPWLEELGGTAGFKRGFTTVEYETEVQHQQLGGFKQALPDFGRELPDDVQIKRPTSPFKYEPGSKFKATDPSPWLTNTKMMGLAVTTRKDSEDENNVYSTMLKPTMPIPQLENYRKTWTHDNSEKFRQIRWTTETQHALNSGLLNKKFELTTIRLLPGTPKSFETFREQLLQKYGILSFIILKYEFYQINQNNDYNNHNTNEILISQFRSIIMNRLNVNVKAHDVNQMIAYITPSSTMIPIDKFTYTLKGNMNQFDRTKVFDLFDRLLQLNNLSNDRMKLDHLLQGIDAEKFPEISEGLSIYAPIYSFQGTNVFTKNEFLELMQDMYAASPDLYAESLKTMWKA